MAVVPYIFSASCMLIRRRKQNTAVQQQYSWCSDHDVFVILYSYSISLAHQSRCHVTLLENQCSFFIFCQRCALPDASASALNADNSLSTYLSSFVCLSLLSIPLSPHRHSNIVDVSFRKKQKWNDGDFFVLLHVIFLHVSMQIKPPQIVSLPCPVSQLVPLFG